MKFNNILLSLALGSLLVGFTACIDEVEYQPAEPAPVTEYYFPTTNLTSQSLVDGTNSFNVTVARANSNGAATLTINSSVSPDNPFEIPSSVEFADGIGTVTFQVKYDLSNVEVNQHYTMKLWLDGIENTPYSYGEFEIDILYLTWRDFPKNESIGIYREDLLTTFYNVPVTTYKVKIQQHPTIDGIYRLVYPYGPSYPYNAPGDYAEEECYMVINATSPKGVYVEAAWQGLNWGAGELYVSSMAYHNMQNGSTLDEQIKAGNCGTIEKGIIKMPVQSMLVTEESKLPSLYYGNLSGEFKVVLPGYEDEPEWEEVGMCDFTDGLLSPIVIDQKDNKYKVLVEKSLLQDDFYRVVNPWGPESGLTDVAPAVPTYLNFSVADPDFVLIEETETVFGFGPTKPLYVSSLGCYLLNYADMTEAEVKADGYYGTFKDGVIAFGKNDAAGIVFNLETGEIENVFTPEVDYPEAATPTILDLNSAVKTEGGEDAETQAVKRFIQAGAPKVLNQRRIQVSKSNCSLK